jgi:hypothetical protein
MPENDGHRPAALTPVLLGLGLLPLLLLWPTLLGDRALVGVHTAALSPWRAVLPQGLVEEAIRDSLPIAADKTIQFQPLLAASLDRLTSGEAPLWNPHNLGGVPLLAQSFQGALYPPSWLAVVMSWPQAFGWIAWLQAAMAGIFAALLLSELGAGRRAAFLAGTTYMLCGYLSARWHWYQIHGCSAMLPLALWGLERLCRTDLDDDPRARLRALLATTAAVALAWLSGWLQGAVHLVYVGALWVAVRTFASWRAGLGRAALAGVGRSVAALSLGMAIAMPQLGPTLEYVSGDASARTVESPEVLQGVAMQPVALLALLAPDVFGHPRDLARHELPQLRTRGALGQAVLDQADNDNFVESASTIGIVALLLAALGACRAHRGRSLGLTLFLAGLVLALDTPLVLLVARLPGLASGDPQRFLLLASMGGTILAALGLQRLIDGGLPRGFGLAALAASVAAGAGALWAFSLTPESFTELLVEGIVSNTGLPRAEIVARSAFLSFDLELMREAITRMAVLLGLAWLALLMLRRRPVIGIAALLLLASGDQAFTGWRNASSVPAEHLFEQPPGLELLLDDDGGRMVRFHELGVSSPLEAPLPPNTGLPFGVSDLGGYWALAPRRMIDVLEGLEPGCTGNRLGQVAFRDPILIEHPALDLLAVSRVLSPAPIEGRGLVLLGAVGDAWLAARPSAQPRAWFTTARAVADPQEALAALLDPLADPTGPAPLLPVDGQAPPDQPSLPPGAEPVAVTFVVDLPEQIELIVEAPQAGVLVLADNWMQGWSASVDGAPATLWPAWYTLRGVVVPAGRHVVRMSYDSPAFRLGLILCGCALIVVALLWRRAYRRVPV